MRIFGKNESFPPVNTGAYIQTGMLFEAEILLCAIWMKHEFWIVPCRRKPINNYCFLRSNIVKLVLLYITVQYSKTLLLTQQR